MNDSGLGGAAAPGRAGPLEFSGLQWDQLVHSLPIGIYSCDLDGRLVQYNHQATILWGHAPAVGTAEFRFCGAYRTYAPSGGPLPPSESPMAEVLRTGQPIRGREFIIERPDGSRIHIQASAEPLFDERGAVVGGVNCFQDITDRKTAEDRQADDRAVLRGIIETTPECIKIVARDGTLLQMNSAGRQMIEATGSDEIEGACVFDIIAPEWRESWRAKHEQVCKGDKLSWEFEIVGLCGTRRHMETHAVPLKMPDGSFAQLAITRDITRRKQDISQLKNTQDSLVRRMKEQIALYQFTDRLYRTESLIDAYDSALDAILTALRCDRASILCFDETGVMRFLAWRGLSAAYRAAVEGHSPWKPGDTDPRPIFMHDIDAADIPDPLKATVKAEGIRALAFIPLVANGGVIGKFMTYYEAPHVFTEEEIDLAVTIARQLGFAVERKRAADARQLAEQGWRENEERLRLATQTGKVGLWDWDLAADRVSWTDSLYSTLQVNKEDFDATVEGFLKLVHPDDRSLVRNAIERTLTEDAPYELEFRVLTPDGQTIWLFSNAQLVREGERPVRLVGATVNITGRKEAESQRDLLVAELSHRVKNTLATVISIAHQSFSRGQSVEEARRSFAARIQALAQTHGRLAEAKWSGVSFKTILLDEFAPYIREDGGNVHLSGPDITLNSKSAVTLGMAFHELVTNAVKHGALSASEGVVDVAWKVVDPDRQLQFRWTESNGPKVAPPERSGFGRLLLERVLAADLKGDVRMEFAEQGLNCLVSFPLQEHASLNRSLS
jgi:PAS domain S-box-containing protein